MQRKIVRGGLSLLEVILAIAILGGAMAAVGMCLRVGTQAASDARELTIAQLLCESKLAEVVAGIVPTTGVSSVPVEVAPDWLYTVESQPSTQSGLLLVAVTVHRDPAFATRPIGVTLYRWIIDPQIASQLPAEPNRGPSGASASSMSRSSGSLYRFSSPGFPRALAPRSLLQLANRGWGGGSRG